MFRLKTDLSGCLRMFSGRSAAQNRLHYAEENRPTEKKESNLTRFLPSNTNVPAKNRGWRASGGTLGCGGGAAHRAGRGGRRNLGGRGGAERRAGRGRGGR